MRLGPQHTAATTAVKTDAVRATMICLAEIQLVVKFDRYPQVLGVWERVVFMHFAQYY